MKQVHRSAKAKARAALFAIYEKAAGKDADVQKKKPAVLKEIDKALDDHIFRPLFT